MTDSRDSTTARLLCGTERLKLAMIGEPTPTVLPSPGDRVTLRCLLLSAALKVSTDRWLWLRPSR